VLRERALAPARTLPRRLDIHLDVHDERVEPFDEPGSVHRPAAERDHARLPGAAGVCDGLRFELAERGLPARREEVRDRAMRALELGVDVPERPPEPLRDRLPERRLARAHEADEDEVPV